MAWRGSGGTGDIYGGKGGSRAPIHTPWLATRPWLHWMGEGIRREGGRGGEREGGRKGRREGGKERKEER